MMAGYDKWFVFVNQAGKASRVEMFRARLQQMYFYIHPSMQFLALYHIDVWYELCVIWLIPSMKPFITNEAEEKCILFYL